MTEQAVPFYQDPFRLHAAERHAHALADLLVRHDRPVNLRRARVPVSARVLAARVGLGAAGAHDGLRAEQGADAARPRVSAAGAVVTARDLYRLPAFETVEQFADERRLPGVGREAADGDDCWPHRSP